MTQAVMAGDETAQAGASGSNRRAHTRLRAEDLKGLGARLASGAEIRLIDLSRGGAQFECDRRFLPNSTISLRLVTPDSTFVVSGRVVRSRIVRLERGGLGYNVAVSFNEPLQHLIEEPTPAPAPDAEPAAATTTAATAVEPTPSDADVTAEEAAAFEATAPTAPTTMTVTAAVDRSGEELRDLFNGNNW